jgi:hypothetical protein
MQDVVRQHLQRAQARMKRQADKTRAPREFAVGDLVYLKLLPYVQSSVALTTSCHSSSLGHSALKLVWDQSRTNCCCLLRRPSTRSFLCPSSRSQLVPRWWRLLFLLTLLNFRCRSVSCSAAGLPVLIQLKKCLSSGPRCRWSCQHGSRYFIFVSSFPGHWHGGMPLLKRRGVSAPLAQAYLLWTQVKLPVGPSAK